MFTTETNTGGVAAAGSEARLTTAPSSHRCIADRFATLQDGWARSHGRAGPFTRHINHSTAEDYEVGKSTAVLHLTMKHGAGSCWHRENHEMEAILLYRLA